MTDSDVKVTRAANEVLKTGVSMDVRRIVDAVVEVVEPMARQKGLNVAIRCAPDLPERLQGDGRYVEHVLLELAKAAVAATERGFVAISARPVAEADGGLGIELLVRDTSSGAVPRDTPGEVLARAVQGRLEVETQANEGTTVRFVFPAAVYEDVAEETATEWGGLPGTA